MHLLIVKLGSIGDIVHTLPTLAAIRRHLPEAKIGWVVERRSAEILRGNPLIDRLIEVDTRALRGGNVVSGLLREVRQPFRTLRRERFDLAIDFQGLIKSAAIAKLSGAKRRAGFGKSSLREPASRIFLNQTFDVPPRSHVISKNLSLAASALQIPIAHDDLEFPVAVSEADQSEAQQILQGIDNKRFVILNPAGGWPTKLWPAAKYGRLADLLWEELGLRSMVAVGPAETELAERVLAASTSAAVSIVQPGLKAFYVLAKSAAAYVGGDTGPTHLAIAAGVPIVGIFGPTEWWRNGSPDPKDICVERLDIDCRVDCHRRACSNWICMNIAPETVFDAVRKRLKQ